MESFYGTCRWLGRNRAAAIVLGVFTIGAAWACAGIGCSLDSKEGGRNLVDIWAHSDHANMLRTATILNLIGWVFNIIGCIFIILALMVSGSIWCVFLGLMACVFLGLMAIGGILPAVELIDAIKDGRDLFAFAIPEMQASVLPKSKIMTSVANATSNWDPRVRIGVGYLWAWGAGYAMLSAFLLIVFGFLAFWLLMFALDRGGQSPTRDYGPRDDLPEVPPVGSGHTVKAGFGGPFADVVATLDGNHVKKGHGGPLADVIATVEGNRIKKGYGGPLADVIATIEGSQIKQGYGGPFAEVIATIEGNQVKAGYGGPFSDTLYTAE